MEINLDDIFVETQTSDESEEVTTESEEILDEQTSEEEVIEEDLEETEEVEEEDVRNIRDIEIKFQDDEPKKLSDFTDDEIQMYHQLGRKSEFQIEKANTKAQETVQDFVNTAELYGVDTSEFLTQLNDHIFRTMSEEPGGKNEGRHVDDIRNEYNANNKGF